MNKAKGSGNKILLKVLEKHHIDIERQLLPRLTASEKHDFLRPAIAWVDIPLQAEGSSLYEAAMLLYPGDPKQALIRLGETMSKEAPWFYKIFFRIPTKEFLFLRMDKLFHAFFDTGQAEVIDQTSNSATMAISAYPQFPEYMWHYMIGWFKGFMLMLNVRLTSITHDDSNPKQWKWIMKW